MEQSVILITNTDEVLLGTVDEIINGADDQSCLGMSFSAAITDIVADILGSQEGPSKLFAIEIR